MIVNLWPAPSHVLLLKLAPSHSSAEVALVLCLAHGPPAVLTHVGSHQGCVYRSISRAPLPYLDAKCPDLSRGL